MAHYSRSNTTKCDSWATTLRTKLSKTMVAQWTTESETICSSLSDATRTKGQYVLPMAVCAEITPFYYYIQQHLQNVC